MIKYAEMLLEAAVNSKSSQRFVVSVFVALMALWGTPFIVGTWGEGGITQHWWVYPVVITGIFTFAVSVVVAAAALFDYFNQRHEASEKD